MARSKNAPNEIELSDGACEEIDRLFQAKEKLIQEYDTTIKNFVGGIIKQCGKSDTKYELTSPVPGKYLLRELQKEE